MRRRKGQSEADIASRKSSQQRKLDGQFLEGTESSFQPIAAADNQGFRAAWHQDQDPAIGESLDAAIDVGQTDTLDDLDKSRLRQLALGFSVVVCVVIGVGWFTQRNAEEQEPATRSVVDPELNVLASPIDDRDYEPGTGETVITPVVDLGEWFVERGSTGVIEPRSVDALGVDSPDVAAAAGSSTYVATVFWAGRLHVAVVSDRALLSGASECVVVALAADDLSSVDVAGVGECGDAFDATGDRLACQGTNALMVEVWPENPDAVTAQPLVASVRTRIEYVAGEDRVSQRGVMNVSGRAQDLVSTANALLGEPGETVQLAVDGQPYECELADRSAVEVRLLPG